MFPCEYSTLYYGENKYIQINIIKSVCVYVYTYVDTHMFCLLEKYQHKKL